MYTSKIYVVCTVTPPIVTAYTKGPNNVTVSRPRSLFPFRAPPCTDTWVLSLIYAVVIVVWTGTVCFWNGKRSPLAHCVCDCDSESSRGCLLSFVYWVSELSPLPQLSVGEQHSKVNNSTSPLFLFAIFKACWYPFSLYPPSSSFSHHHLLGFWLSLAFSHPQHLSLSLLELAN